MASRVQLGGSPATRLPENNVTQNVSKRDSDLSAKDLNLGLGENDLTGPSFSNLQAEALGGDVMTPEARRQYINLKRERYQASQGKQERGQMLEELIWDGIYKNIKSANRAMLQTFNIGSRIHQRGRKAVYNDITKACLKQVWKDSQVHPTASG